MRSRHLLLIFILILLPADLPGPLASSAEPGADPPRSPGRGPGFAREVRLRLDPAGGRGVAGNLRVGRPERQQVTIVSVRLVAGAPQRQRNPELSPGNLVLVALDASGRERSRTIILDPRLLRAETAGPDGALRSEILYRESVEFTVALPADETIRRIEIYQPRWEEPGPVLDLVGEARIP